MSVSVQHSPFGMVISAHDPNRMNLVKIGRMKPYRPWSQAELSVRREAEAAFWSKHAPAVRTDRKAIAGISAANVERLLASFTVTKTNIDLEGRVAWKPKREHRAYRRGLVEMPQATGPHLT